MYYFYIDEGGLFGNCNICITSKKLKQVDSKYDSHICNYYFGKISSQSIISHLKLFKIAYPKCNINFDELSEIKNLDTEVSM